MKPVRLWFAVALLAGTLWSSPAEALTRKCRATPGGIPVRDPTKPLVMVDGVVTARELKGLQIEPADIWGVQIVCIEVIEDGVKVARTVMSIVTKAGAASMMQVYLRALVEEQEAFRSRTGGYARTLDALGFYATRPPLPIEMQVTEAGWTARSELKGVPTRCQVTVDKSTRGGQAPTAACAQG